MSKENIVIGLKVSPSLKVSCHSCRVGKLRISNILKNTSSAPLKALQVITSDLCGSLDVLSNR